MRNMVELYRQRRLELGLSWFLPLMEGLFQRAGVLRASWATTLAGAPREVKMCKLILRTTEARQLGSLALAKEGMGSRRAVPHLGLTSCKRPMLRSQKSKVASDHRLIKSFASIRTKFT